MADKKKDDGQEAEGKKKGLPAIVLVAVGAALGGVGVVFAVPPKVVEVEVEKPEIKEWDIEHPDVLEFVFNPVSKTGRGTAKFKFQFVYRTREDLEHEAFERIKETWNDSYSRVLTLLSQRSMAELRTEAGIRMAEKAVIDELNRAIFPAFGHEEPIAEVVRLLWQQKLFQ